LATLKELRRDSFIEWEAFSTSTTFPFFIPDEELNPIPNISIPLDRIFPINVQTLLVPTSTAAIVGFDVSIYLNNFKKLPPRLG
jgi:hypothetical protein